VVTIVVGGAGAVAGVPAGGEAAGPSLEEELRDRIRAGQAPSAIAREVARARGLRRADVYATLERLRTGGSR